MNKDTLLFSVDIGNEPIIFIKRILYHRIQTCKESNWIAPNRSVSSPRFRYDHSSIEILSSSSSKLQKSERKQIVSELCYHDLD